MPEMTHTAKPGTAGTAVLGKTLPQVLYEACDRYTNPRALNQPIGEGWKPLSLDDFRDQSEQLALGLLDIGLERGDRVAYLLNSDVYFCLADMGCLIAGIINVPVYLSQAPEHMRYVIDHAEAKAIFVANAEQLARAAELLPNLPRVQTVIVAEPDTVDTPPELPEGVTLLSMDDVRAKGRNATDDQAGDIAALRSQIDKDDLATLIYTSGTTGQPKGVMLSHENISFNAMTSISCLDDFEPGPEGEVIISFLPLTHVFARSLHYGFMGQGMSIYFTTPDDLVQALPKVRPTAFATVPRVLEKVYAGIQKKIMDLEGIQKSIGTWALGVARRYEIGEQSDLLYKLQRSVADSLVYKKWREALGGRIKYLAVGGAALNADLANTLAAADIIALQGYGLTETSPVISVNRPDNNRAGTVGEPIPGVEVKIADDGEILTRGPHVMQGYYKEEEKTHEAIDEEGWFHTGDIGEFTPDGFLRITDRKKDLFKLSTGKYVMPQPIENKLGGEPLVEQIIVIGSGHKFCSALIFPAEDHLRSKAKAMGLNAEQRLGDLIKEPEVVKMYQDLVDEANKGMDHWSTVKRFALIPDSLSIESGLLTPTLKVKRPKVRETYGEEINALYDETQNKESRTLNKSVIVAG